jgi:penicillin-binding protein 2
MTLIKAHAEVSEFKKRFRWMYLFVVLCFLVLSGRLFYLQIVRGEHYTELGRENIIRQIERPAVRGTIRDARGRVLATNRPSHDVLLTPHFFDLDDLPMLSDFLGHDPARAGRLREQLEGFAEDDLRRFQPFVAEEDVGRDALALIETHLTDLSGVEVQSTPVRTYPFGDLTAHLVGYVNEITVEELQEWSDRDYHPGELVGRVGIERAREADLRGTRGWDRIVVNARGLPRPETEQRTVLGDERTLEPRPGHDLTLTVDIGLQRIVERALRGHPSAAVVVLEVNTGRILAIVSKPSFDPNAMTGGLSPEQALELTENPLQPQFNRPLMGTYSPGSTFKVVTAIAALEEGVITPSESLYCGGFHELGRRAFRCSQTHGEVDLRQAIIQSCNVYFYRVSERHGMMDAITRYAEHLGFGEPTGLGMGERPGRVDSRDQHREFRLGHALNAAIGQGRTLVTVLQLASAYAAIANGGLLYRPQIVRRIETADGEVVQDFPPVVRRRLDIAPEHLELLTEALVGVVHNPQGTAYDPEVAGLDIAGKTGTAEVPPTQPTSGQAPHQLGRWFFNRDHGWFAGFAPSGDPQIAVAVLIEHGGTGGRSAAPVALRIFRDYFQEIAGLQEDFPADGETEDLEPAEAEVTE